MDELYIGKQIWSNKNLDTKIFQNGDEIPETTTEREWNAAGHKNQPAWCYYENNPENGEKYGRLYNWYAVNDPMGLAPIGWYIPSDLDWKKLSMNLGKEVVADKLKDNSAWKGYGNNESGFSALPSGIRGVRGFFCFLNLNGGWWSSSEFNDSDAISRTIKYDYGGFLQSKTDYKSCGLSVRCLKF